MIPIFSSLEAKQTDIEICSRFGILPAVLMENVGKEISISILDKHGRTSAFRKSLIVLCGGGNNGGDGFVIARNLQSYFDVKVVSVGNPDKMSPETALNYRCCKQMLGDAFLEPQNESDMFQIDFRCDLMIDALIGIQSTEEIRGMTGILLRRVSSNDAYKIAVDVPTGFNTNNGKEFEYSFKADEIFTAFGLKEGLLLSERYKMSDIHILDVGIPKEICNRFANKFAIEYADYQNCFRHFSKKTSKFDFGQVAILAGSHKYSGAAVLCANAAISAGAGLVRLYSTEFHSALMPEIIRMQVKPDEDGFIALQNKDYLTEQLAKSDAVAIGPGLGDKADTLELVRSLIHCMPINKPVILDADALRAVDINEGLRDNIIITPHIGEFRRLTGERSDSDISGEWASRARELAKRLNCIVHLKGNPSISSDGNTDFWTVNGSNALSTAGSGDVLTGITLAYCGMGMSPLIAMRTASYAHARTAEAYTEKYSPITFTASKIYEYLKLI